MRNTAIEFIRLALRGDVVVRRLGGAGDDIYCFRTDIGQLRAEQFVSAAQLRQVVDVDVLVALTYEALADKVAPAVDAVANDNFVAALADLTLTRSPEPWDVIDLGPGFFDFIFAFAAAAPRGCA